jgi:predicted TIM-barrel fold metal-dependent hydrolase
VIAAAAEIPVIDADTHFTEPADLWTSRAPAKYRDQVLHVRPGEDGHERWFIGDHFIHWIGPSVIANDGVKHRGMVSLRSYDQMSDTNGRASDRFGVMDQAGIRAAIVYPNVVGFSAARLLQLTQDHELMLFHIRAYNDACAQMQRESNGRLFPQAAMPLWDVGECLKEVKRCREHLDLRGLALPDKLVHFENVPYTHPDWEPFWEACQDYQLPINFHVGTGDVDFTNAPAEGYWGPVGSWGQQTGAEASAEKKTVFDPILVCFMSSQFFMANARTICNLIMSGLLDRFPKLKFVSVESGVGWIPFAIQSIDYTIEELLTPADRARFKRRPKEMFQDQIYASYWFENAKAVETYIHEFGAGNLLFETDFPHPQCLYPSVKEKIAETLGAYDEETKRKILYKNASQLYGIPVD